MFQSQLNGIAKYARFRALVLGGMAAITLRFPAFLADGMVYVIAAYIIISGALGVKSSVNHKSATLIYFTVILCGILCVVYFQHVVSILPVFFGLLLGFHSVVYFVSALCAKSKLRPIQNILSLVLALGGGTLIIFAFGFGGIAVLSKMFGCLLLLSTLCELLIHFTYRKAFDTEGDITT